MGASARVFACVGGMAVGAIVAFIGAWGVRPDPAWPYVAGLGVAIIVVSFIIQMATMIANRPNKTWPPLPPR